MSPSSSVLGGDGDSMVASSLGLGGDSCSGGGSCSGGDSCSGGGSCSGGDSCSGSFGLVFWGGDSCSSFWTGGSSADRLRDPMLASGWAELPLNLREKPFFEKG